MPEGRRRDARPADTRPLVREAGRRFEGPADVATVTIGMVALALATGFIVGFLVFSLMNVSTWLTSLLWDGLGGACDVPWFSLAVCTLGGIVIGLWTHFAKDEVRPLEQVLGTFRRTGSYRMNGVAKPVVSFLLPLVFGGSVGFEAGLTGIITAACCWIRDKLKAAGLRNAVIGDVTIAASLSAIFGTPLAGIVAGDESSHLGKRTLDVDEYRFGRAAKLVLYTAAAFGAFGGIALFSGLFGTSDGLPRFDAISASGAEFLWVLPCLAAAWLMTVLYHGSRVLFSRVSERLSKTDAMRIARPVIAGVVMGAIAMALPYVLFPGEEQAHLLIATWGSWGALALICTGALKAIVTPMCLNMGWIGGHFFPSIFAGAAMGYGLAALTGCDPMLAVTVTTTAFLAGVTRKPLLTLAILLLCFPLHGVLWSGLAAIVGAVLPLPRQLSEGLEERKGIRRAKREPR